MPFSITTKDGITINNIPDDVAPDSEQLRIKVTELRQQRMGQQIEGQEQAKPAFTKEPPGFLRTLQGEAELATTVATGAVLEPFAGVAGIVQGLNPFAEPGAAAQAVEAVRSLAFKPGQEGLQVAKSIGEIAKDITPQFIQDLGTFTGEKFEEIKEATFQRYGPVAGTAVAIAPVAILEAVPGFFAIKKARNMPTTIADEVIEESGDAARNAGENTIKTDIQPEAKDYETITADLKAQNTANLVGEIRPDAEILESAKNLGVDLNPSHYSTNQAFIEMEQALKADPQSKLSQIEQTAILRTGEEADKLITDLGGTLDKSLLDANVKADIQKTIVKLEVDGVKAYSAVNKAIPQSMKVNAETSKQYLNKRLEELGGEKGLLSKSEKQLEFVTELKNNPSYGALDQVRRNVGEALNKQTGPFRDDEERILNQVYGALSNDQQGVADVMGVGADYELGRKAVSTRKGLEKEALNLFGRDIDTGSILPKLKTAAGKLTKGDISTFKKLMVSLPKARRAEAAATMLNEFFVSGARKKGAIGGGFVSAFETLNRNPGAKKIIFEQLPSGAEKRFNDIGKVATGIFKSKRFENTSGTGRAIIAAMNNGNVIEKVIESGIVRGASRVVPGGGIGTDLISSTLRGARGEQTKKAIDFLTSPEFIKSLQDASRGNAVTAERINRTKVFKDWVNAKPPEIKTEIATIGFIPWLTQDINEEN
jgi:hypothetical protein